MMSHHESWWVTLRKPSGWKAHVRFSGKTYGVRLYSTTRWRKISIIKNFALFSPGLDQHFSNRLFQLFSYTKPDKFGIVGKRRFSSFIWRGLEKKFPCKKIFSALRIYNGCGFSKKPDFDPISYLKWMLFQEIAKFWPYSAFKTVSGKRLILIQGS